jgi:hypothetical protein
MDVSLNDSEALNARFLASLDEDRKARDVPEHRARWLFAERLNARGDRKEMSFAVYEGIGHLVKFFNWHIRGQFPDPFLPGLIDPLVAASTATDQRVFADLGLVDKNLMIPRLARYNAQDHILMRAFPVPERNRARVLLDFGAGHGRLANLGFNAPDRAQRLDKLIAVDAIASTYLTQLAYYRALGLRVWEYLEHQGDALTQDAVARALEDHDVIHLPTWRFDLVPDGSVDMVSCIQVLKELPGALVADILKTFARVTTVCGAVYIRDHVQFHNPNHMPVDLLLQTNGFDCEFAPHWRDRIEIHGLPRIWRKVDPSHFVADPNS